MLQTFLTVQFILFTIAANAFIYRIKHIPIIGKKIKGNWYAKKTLKSVLGVFAILRKILFEVFKKLLYVGLMLVLPVYVINAATAGGTFTGNQKLSCFLYIFLLLNLIFGAFFNIACMPNDDTDYIMLKQMHVDPKAYYIGNIFVKTIGETLLFAVVLLLLPCLILDLSPLRVLPQVLLMAMFRFVGVAVLLAVFKRFRINYTDSKSKLSIATTVLILPVTYTSAVFIGKSPMIATVLCSPITFVVCIAAGIWGIFYVVTYKEYRNYANIIVHAKDEAEIDSTKRDIEEASIGIKEGDIKAEDIHTTKYDGLKGYEYLHAIFFDRHKRLVKKKWKIKMILIGVVSIASAITAFVFRDSDVVLEAINDVEKTVPIWMFIMYLMCSGEKICKALFFHCDISLLKYGYYRDSKTMLSNFRIRLRYLVKLDLQPALLLCAGIGVSVLCTGRMDKLIEIIPLMITILLASVFFDIYQLFLYYIFQPYLENYQTKSIGYTICSLAMYWACYGLMQVRLVSIGFTILIGTVTLLCIPLSYFLIYKLAPKRFRLH